MTKIGLLSDTHAYWDDKYLKYFEPCDEIWHAGDIGSAEIADKLQAFRPLRAVYGNIDGQDLRQRFPLTARFTVDGAEVLMKHIGGYPGKYDPSIAATLLAQLELPHGDFTFSKDLLDPRSPHFAFITYPGMMGLLTDTSFAIYDLDAEKPVAMQGVQPERTLTEAKAYLQKLYDDIAKR